MLCEVTGPEQLERTCVSSCSTGQTRCGASCVSLTDNVDHCGACDIICDRSHASGGSCSAAVCSYTCQPGWDDCDKAGNDRNGCETQIHGSDVMNCGACGTQCSSAPAHAMPICLDGECDFACTSGYMRQGNACVVACQGDSLTNAPFAGGDGGGSDPYIICTVAQLDQVRSVATNGQRFRLLADLDLAGSNFAPIGSAAAQFFGYFDGDGHTIANFTYAAPSDDGVGLFGSVYLGTISDLTLTNANVTGRDGVGTLIGDGAPTVQHVTISGVVHGRNRVGGLAGSFGRSGELTNDDVAVDVVGTGNDVGGLIGTINDVSGKVYSAIDCRASGSVSGQDRVGGLVGSAQSFSALEHCNASSAVTGVNQVGGLVGLNQINVTNSYATGAVSGTTQVGGLVGNNGGGVALCYASGKVTGASATGGLVGATTTGPLIYVAHSFFDSDTTTQLTSAGGVGKTTAQMQDTATFATWDTYTRWTFTGGAYPTHRTTPAPCTVGAAAFSGGSGTIADPYLIDSPSQLYHLKCNVYAAVRLTTDLDFTGQAMVPPIGAIYDSGVALRGDFDGNGKSISNWVYYSGTSALFGYTLAGTVHDLTLANVEVGGTYFVAALEADCNATVRNVRVSGGLVRGTLAVGGAIGRAENGCVISHSSSSATVIGAAIAGNSTGPTGGFVGNHNGVITDCYASGAVTGTGTSSGGFAGDGVGSITNAYAVGTSSVANGFANTTSAPVSAYWDTQATGIAMSARGVGKTTSEMQMAATFAGWDFATVWQIAAGGYPTLR
jgi:hypothetical protein